MNFTGCTEKVSEACTHKSFEIIQTVDINQSNSSLIPATTKQQNNWIESCAAYAEFCRSHILPMMNQNKLCHHKGISDREKINLNRSNITRSYEAKSRSASAEFRRGLQGKLRLGVLAEETRCNATLRPRSSAELTTWLAAVTAAAIPSSVRRVRGYYDRDNRHGLELANLQVCPVDSVKLLGPARTRRPRRT